MTDATVPIQVGQDVPDFSLTTFDPAAGKFGKFELAEQKNAKRFTVLFFYPADFTFV
jgi:NADH-dependent peroxiredoxin subunit C